MRVEPAALTTYLSEHWPTGFVIVGDELLLRQEAMDAIRHASKNKGYEERQAIEIDKQTDFDALDSGTANFSLFSSLRVIELVFHSTPNKNGQQYLMDVLEANAPDTVYVIVLPELKWRDLEAAWVKKLLASMVHVPALAVSAEQFPSWLQRRCQQEHLTIDADGMQLLVQWFEGNLLACSQLLKQLVLLYAQEAISVQQIRDVAAESARYQLFDVVDLALSGDAARVLRMWQGLLTEDAAGNMRSVAAILNRDVQQLVELRALIHRGAAPSQAAWDCKIWKNRQSAYIAAAKRFTLAETQSFLIELSLIDQCLKGVGEHSPQLLIERILLRLAGLKGLACAS